MSIRTTLLVATCVLTLPPGAVAAAPPVGADEAAALLELKAARKVRVQVRQDYDRGEVLGDEESRTRPSQPAEKKGFLPLLALTTEITKAAGWTLAAPGEDSAVTIQVDVLGTPLGADYTSVTGGPSGHHYTGARLNGTIVVEKEGRQLLERDFEAEVPVQNPISRSYPAWSDAPFQQLLPEYCAALWLLVGQSVGVAPLVGALEQRDANLREGALRALVAGGDPSAARAMIPLLADTSDEVGRLAALGLGTLNVPEALPPLLAALRTLPSAPPGTDADFRRSWLEKVPERERPEDRRESAQLQLSESGDNDRRSALLWALVQSDAPEKGTRLRAALREGTSPEIRAHAALLLARCEGRASRESLVAALADPSPLVRAAAVYGLNDASADVPHGSLLDATADADSLVRDLARDALAEAQRARWTAHAAATGNGPGARKNREFVSASLRHEDPLIRAEALQGLRAEGVRDHLAAIRTMARTDKLPFLRHAALEALADQRDPQSLDAVIAALADPVPFVRQQALAVLSGSASEWEQSALPPLPASAVEPLLTFTQPEVADDPDIVLALLQRVEGPAGVSAIEQLARGAGPVPLRRQALLLLTKFHPTTTWPLLIELAPRTEGELAFVLRDCLNQIHEPAMAEPLIALLKSDRREARRLATDVLGPLKQPRAVGPLIAALQVAETPGPAKDEILAGGARISLQLLTGRNFPTVAEWRQWWKENAARLSDR